MMVHRRTSLCLLGALALLLVPACEGFAPYKARPAAGADPMGARLRAAPQEMPQTVIDAEENAAGGGRRARIGGFAASGLLSAALGAVGNSDTPLRSAVPLHNSFLGNFLYSAVAGLAGTLIYLEFETKKANQKRIFEEMEARMGKGASRGGGGAPAKKSRKKGKKGKKGKKADATKGFSASGAPAKAAPTKAQQTKAEPAEAEPAKEAAGEYESPTKALGDVMSAVGLSDLYSQADNLARAGAVKLNEELEDKGYLPKLSAEGGAGAPAEEETADGQAPPTAGKEQED